jgi:tetratricopeptide (TPR) repeat protein
VSLRRSGQLDEARLTLEETVALRPDYAPAHFNLAEVYRQQLDRTNNATERAELVALAFEEYTNALAWGYDPVVVIERRAGLALFSEDLEQAEADLLTMTQDPSIDGRVLHLLGRVKKEQGRLDIALTLMKMAETKGYGAAELYADLGEVQLRTGDLEGALRSLERAVELRDDLVVTRVNLSIVHSQLGDLDAAEEVLREAEALDPESELVRTQREALRQLRERS